VPDLSLRESVRKGDPDAVREIVEATRVFSAAEVETAVDLVREALRSGASSGYRFLFAERGERGLGYTCYGAIPATAASFDLYWIAVRPEAQQHGIGHLLLSCTEERVAGLGGQRIYIETSYRKEYARTREFYARAGYTLEATLGDFYAPGDHKCVYVKVLDLK
jgi:GNAT superfamily N-acetyltransferase